MPQQPDQTICHEFLIVIYTPAFPWGYFSFYSLTFEDNAAEDELSNMAKAEAGKPQLSPVPLLRI